MRPHSSYIHSACSIRDAFRKVCLKSERVRRETRPAGTTTGPRGASQRAALADTAQIATARIYADVLWFWRQCQRKKCKRHRRCAGEPMACLKGHMPSVAPHNHEAARSWVMLGGRTRIPPADRVEHEMRRTPASMWFR